MEAQLARLSHKVVLAGAVRYALNQWDAFVRFLEDGRIELDTNTVERAMRAIALNRKNALFAGHDEGAANWACIASLIETCKIPRPTSPTSSPGLSISGPRPASTSSCPGTGPRPPSSEVEPPAGVA